MTIDTLIMDFERGIELLIKQGVTDLNIARMYTSLSKIQKKYGDRIYQNCLKEYIATLTYAINKGCDYEQD